MSDRVDGSGTEAQSDTPSSSRNGGTQGPPVAKKESTSLVLSAVKVIVWYIQPVKPSEGLVTVGVT